MLRLTALIVFTAAATGCSWQQAYSTAQGWQRNACNRLTEQAERERCLSSTAMSYEDYRRRTQDTKQE